MSYLLHISVFTVFCLLTHASPLRCEDVLGAVPDINVPLKTIDLGTFSRDETPSGEFAIRNDGGAPLNIFELKPSCGCTVAESAAKVVMPGESINVKVSIDVSGKIGKIKKSVDIKTDDPDEPLVKVEILADILIKEHSAVKHKDALFKDKCAECHSKPGEGKEGEPLFEAICANCHGHYGLGGFAKRINNLEYLERRGDDYIRRIISEGQTETSMPGFSKSAGGPLDEKQIESLAELMRWWQEGFVFKENERRSDSVFSRQIL